MSGSVTIDLLQNIKAFDAAVAAGKTLVEVKPVFRFNGTCQAFSNLSITSGLLTFDSLGNHKACSPYRKHLEHYFDLAKD